MEGIESITVEEIIRKMKGNKIHVYFSRNSW